ncbi:D-alanyl-D-alanine carboxypeptidase family protein [Candidatus Liberibacter brunswickensis]|uniref:D-alanyl-D-alanine carboxypeptidase family protein n=1 Tax=Candidatus Liberibacter brunswickensis TaxID=1968796 RepID=UPI002FE3FA97
MTSKSYAKPKYSSFVIDVKTKQTNGFKQDELRYPASLTKMMTLYIVFEYLQSKKIHLNTKVPVSYTAARQNPSKLYLKEKTNFTIEKGILALITRSANDVSTAFGEFISGSEKKFAILMSNKAKEIGMKNTIYKNASGLHDKNQVTTARDQAILGIMLRKKFPEYYKYFSVRKFRYKNRIIMNHNKLLNKMHGIDGIKTGYTRNSGFNIVTSLQYKDNSIVAVVMGMQTYQARDQKALELISSFSNKKIFKNKQTSKKNDITFISPKKYLIIKQIRDKSHKSQSKINNKLNKYDRNDKR